MGYTHYWRQPDWSAADRQGFVQALPFVRDIVHRRYALILCRSFGLQKPPTVNAREIHFNGQAGCEDFLCLNHSRRFDFCKTGHQPYDLPVCEVLLVLHTHCPGLELSSDGLAMQGGRLVLSDANWMQAHERLRQHYPALVLRELAIP